jgi:subtilisin family serine protease
MLDGTVFGPEDDNKVPGELILKLVPSNLTEVTSEIPIGPARHLEEALPTTLGIPSIDQILEQFGSRGLTQITGPVLAAAAGDGAAAEGLDETAAGLASSFRVRIDEAADVEAAAAQLQQAPEVEAAEPNRFREAVTTQPNDPDFAQEWGLTKIRAPEAWDIQKGDPAVVVAVIDTGIDLDHPDLIGNLVAGRDLVDITGPAKAGWHFEGDINTPDDIPEDEVGHGTHVAGTIAAMTDNSLGVAGVSWTSKLMPVRVLARIVRDSDGRVSGVGTAVDIAAGIVWAVDHGARIINMSLGGYADTFVERSAVIYAIAHNVLVVAAMGNDNTSQPSFPAAYPGVIAVGAIGQDDKRAAFSNTGSHIAVVAPGVGVHSTFMGGGFSDLSGTSMATPHVAGVAALLSSAKGSLTAVEMATALRATARPLTDSAADPIPNPKYGSGLIDARAALDQLSPAPKPPGPTPTPVAPPFPGRLLKFPPLTVGADVEQWQTRMVQRGFPLVVDGKYGPKSKEACQQFQAQRGLQVDGIVGPITWAATFDSN